MSDRALRHMARRTGLGFALGFAVDVAIQALVLVQNLLVPRLIGPEHFGLFALALAVVSVGTSLREFGVHEKIVQEQDTDLPRAYSVAFTMEVAMATGMVLLALVAAPLVANWYDRPELVPIIAVLAFTIYNAAFANLPSALYLRRLQYGRRNVLISVGPVTRFAVTVPLAFLGAGVWSLVAGAVAGLVASAAALYWATPLRPRLRVDGELVRRFFRYGWPLWVAGLLGISTTIGGTFVISTFLGIAALGYFSLAQRFAQQAFRLDVVLAQAILPALTRSLDDTAGQRRAFEATNRLTVLWAGPLGFGMAVFAEDLVRFLLGAEWSPAVFLFQMQGLAITTGSIGYSWDVFFRARGNTRPTLWFHAVSEAWVFAALLPAAILFGLDGAAIAIGSLGLFAVFVRQWFVRRLFPGVNLVVNTWRELVATGGAALALFGLRRFVWMPGSLVGFAGQLVLFAALCVLLVLALDRRFVFGLLGRLRRPIPAAETVAPPPAGDERPGPAPEQIAGLPGLYPLSLAAGADGALWVTLRDSSSIARLDLATGAWRSRRAPAYPHNPAVDDQGRAWTALTLAGAVDVYDVDLRRVRRHRLGRSRELLVTAWAGDHCVAVDAGRKLLWRLGDGAPRAVPLPAGMRRPDVVAIGPDGDCWVGDTAAAAVARIGQDDRCELVAVPGVQRGVAVDPRDGAVWLGHAAEPLLTRLDPSGGARSYTLPGVPFGLCLGPDGRAWVTLADLDAVIAVSAEGALERTDLGPGDRPSGIAWCQGRLFVACAGSSRLLELPVAVHQ